MFDFVTKYKLESQNDMRSISSVLQWNLSNFKLLISRLCDRINKILECVVELTKKILGLFLLISHLVIFISLGISSFHPNLGFF